MEQALLWAAAGTGFTFLMTTLGSAAVFLFRGRSSAFAQRVFLGFAAGVMIAASVWSLLIPAIERAEEAGQLGWIPAAGGFALGVAFLLVLHNVIPHLHPGERNPEGLPSRWERPTLLFTAVTLHNIPEGMSVIRQRSAWPWPWPWVSASRTCPRARLSRCRCSRRE